MIARIRPGGVLALARARLPAPVDVVNLITTRRFDRYRWYAVLVTPALAAVGGRVLWMARFDAALAGDQQAEKLLLVRYPSHRRFLAMTLNPYYVAINRLREDGVRRFEAAFTHASFAAGDLARRHTLVGVHFGTATALEDIGHVMRAHGFALAYATSTVANLGFLDPPAATDPNPLAYAQLALFDGDGDAAAAALELAGAADCAVHRYAREPRSAYRPKLRG